MPGYTPSYGAPGTEPEYVGSRNEGKRARRPRSPKRPNDHEQSAAYKTSISRKARNRRSLAGQIRSLEKLLKHPGAKLTADVRQEKGRELAALVLERERKKATLRATKNLGKYHMVRFVERQKCERNLKQLHKKLEQVQDSRKRAAKNAKAQAIHDDSDSDIDVDGGVALPNARELDLDEQIRQAEVDLKYTIYAPLGEKYISLFPPTGEEKITGMSKMSRSFLKPEEEAEVRRLKDDNIVRNATGEKPPMWYTVEKCTQDGTLEQLRDGKLNATPINLPQIGGKSQITQRGKRMPAWVHEDGAIATEDLDSKEDSGDGDDDDQKIDGGFFERA